MSAEGSGHVWRHFPRDEDVSVFLVALAIGDVVNDTHDHEFFMSQRELAKKVGLHRTTVNDAVKQMVAIGWLVQIEDNAAHRQPNKYRFVFDLSRPVAWAVRSERERWQSEAASLAGPADSHWQSEAAQNSRRTQLNNGVSSSDRKERDGREHIYGHPVSEEALRTEAVSYARTSVERYVFVDRLVSQNRSEAEQALALEAFDAERAHLGKQAS